ncbi:hypothetical protein BH23BAC1_BH23BAC1_23580 [soil metagenome]
MSLIFILLVGKLNNNYNNNPSHSISLRSWKRKNFIPILFLFCSIFYFSQCSERGSKEKLQAEDETASPPQAVAQTASFGGFQSQVELGEHIVVIAGCNDCHTPKKMTAQGPVLDTALWLSGHPAQMPPPDVDRKDLERKGIAATNTLTAWVGPWGISFAANLTSDETGIGNWQESNFFTAMRHGKYKGIESGRNLLPPMPWDMYRHMTDDEIKAVFAYLKSTKPIKNQVPAPVPPVLIMAGK